MKIAPLAVQADKLEMNMTPMIDVCFQLIIFFMLSLRLLSPEGDFGVKMPLASPRQALPDDSQTPPIKVRLRANADGGLASIQMGLRTVEGFDELRRRIHEIADLDRGASDKTGGVEVELDFDYNLKYEYVVEALSAAAGYLADDRQTVVRMIDKIRFAPPRK